MSGRFAAASSSVFYLCAARAERGIGDEFAAIILPAYLIEIGFASMTAVPRSLASSLNPALSGTLLSTPFAGLPMSSLGECRLWGIEYRYDISLLCTFRPLTPPEEVKGSRP